MAVVARYLMNSKSLVLSLPSLILGFAISGAVCAQTIQPTPVELGTSRAGRLDDTANRNTSNHPFACYSLNTKPGEEVSIRVKSSAFDPALAVARGALCTAAALQFENDNVDETSKDALVSFRAAGGRYLIFVRGTSPESRGSYQLKLDAGLNKPAQKQATASNDADARRRIMAMEIEKRNAELAAAEAKRKAEQAQAEAQRAALLAEQRSWEQHDDYAEDYQDNYDNAPATNFLNVFVNTFANEVAAQQQAQQEFQRGLDQAIRSGQAEYQRRLAAEQVAQDRQAQATRQAAAQQAQAAEAQRLAAERARAASEASRRVALAQEQRASSAQRTPDRLVAHPAGGQTPAASSSPQGNRASTRNNPASCVTGPELVKNPNCPNGAGSRVLNQCAHTIDARICHWTTRDRWDCGTTTVKPGTTGGFPSCFGTGRMWMTVQYSDQRTKFADPP